MDRRQRPKLSPTNRSNGLILLRATRSGKPAPKTPPAVKNTSSLAARLVGVVDCARRGDLVVMARCPAPDPIPNSAVKRLSADGTAS